MSQREPPEVPPPSLVSSVTSSLPMGRVSPDEQAPLLSLSSSSRSSISSNVPAGLTPEKSQAQSSTESGKSPFAKVGNYLTSTLNKLKRKVLASSATTTPTKGNTVFMNSGTTPLHQERAQLSSASSD